MEAVQYLRAIRRSWWIVLLAVVAGGLGGFGVYAKQTPVYQAGVRLVVTLNAPNLDPVSAASLGNARAMSLAQVAGTGPAVAAAASAAGYPGAAPGVSASASSVFVEVTVTSASPKLAAAMANTYVTTLPTSASKLTGLSSNSFKLQQLGRAGVPADPIRPIFTRDVGFGVIGGLVIGLALALLRDVLNRSIRSSDDLRKVTGLTILGTIPRDMPKVLLPALTESRSSRAEAYRQVRTSLQAGRADRPGVRIAFTSAVQSEGKTSVASNVAIMLARAGHRVAIVDADLRRPRVAAFFKTTPRFGLIDVLSRKAELDDALFEHEQAGLVLLTSGGVAADTASELLGSEVFDKVLDELEARYEFVLIDTPPVLPVTDALAMAPKVQGIVLVVRLGYTSRVSVEHALSALDRIDANVWGVVPNQAGRGSDSDYRYPYRYAASKRKGADESTALPPSNRTPGPAPQ